MLPVFASFGAAAVPALIYVRLVDVFDEPRLSIGWPVSLAMDLAIAYFVARLIFRTHPVIPFLLLLEIASDALGFLSLAVLNQTREVHLVSGASRGSGFCGCVVAVAVGQVVRDDTRRGWDEAGISVVESRITGHTVYPGNMLHSSGRHPSLSVQ